MFSLNYLLLIPLIYIGYLLYTSNNYQSGVRRLKTNRMEYYSCLELNKTMIPYVLINYYFIIHHHHLHLLLINDLSEID